MKKLILLLSLFVSTSAFAGQTSIKLQVPADSDIVRLTVREIGVDVCNHHSLQAFDGFGADTNQFHIGVVSTEIACRALGFKMVDLSTDIVIDKNFGQPDSIILFLDTDPLSKLEIEFDSLAQPY